VGFLCVKIMKNNMFMEGKYAPPIKISFNDKGLSLDDLLSNKRSHLTSVRYCDEQIWELLKKYRTKLPKKEYTVLKMRLKDNLILEEVGKEFGVTRERVRQIEAKAMEKLRLLQEGYILKGNRIVWNDILKQKQEH